VSFVAKLMSFVRLILVAGAVAALGTAQDGIRYVAPDKFERATKTDEANMIQWADHVQTKCTTCQGNGKTKCTTCDRFPDEAKVCPECKRVADRLVPCRACAGTGFWPDPLEKVTCCACFGAGFQLCVVCSGGGSIKVQGSGDKWLDCPGCRGSGGFKCGVCDGKRLVEVAALKPSLRDANAATLQKAIASTDTILQGLGAFTPTGRNSRKEVKEINRLLTMGQALFPPIKRTPKVLEDYMGKTYGGSNFVGHEEGEAHAMQSVKGSAEYYLKHQKRMMELALKRAEANEKLAAENKPK
jgi:hypothetical protein